MKGTRQFQQVVGQQVGAEILQNGRHHLAEADQHAGQVDFLVVTQHDLTRGSIEGGIELAEDRANPDITVLQIGCGVAVQGEHAVPGKHIVG